MSRPFGTRRCAQRGMTLLEIMIVVVIIGLVTSVVGVTVFVSKLKAERKLARTQIDKLGDAVEHYALEHRTYPTTAEGLAALTVAKADKRPLLEYVPLDPWGNAYVYRWPGERRRFAFDLSSHGEDGLPGTADDIGNWQHPQAQR